MEILTCDPLICSMNPPRLVVSIKMEEFIRLQKFKRAFIFKAIPARCNNHKCVSVTCDPVRFTAIVLKFQPLSSYCSEINCCYRVDIYKMLVIKRNREDPD